MQNISEIFTTLMASLRDVGTIDVLINVLLSAAMSYLIYRVYVRYGTSLSNRKHFGGSFLLITICTSLIIALIKSSIALSLGLVGALSIIRFRTAIKEPQELTYIFFCIAMGLGFGANERVITLASGFLVLAILLISGRLRSEKIEDVYNITVNSKKMAVGKIVSTVGKHCARVDLRRFDQKEGVVNVLLFAEFKSYDDFQDCIAALNKEDSKVGVNFVAARTIG
jgi:hypothetical protein